MSFIDQSSLVITASVCLSCCGGTIEAPFKMHRVNTVHAAHAINSLVASWCSMYCTPFVARCAQKPDAQRAKVNLTTWQSTWKSGQPWCSWDTVLVSLLWKGIYWNFTGTSKLQKLNDTYVPVPLWTIRESKVGCVWAQICSLPLNSVINLHQGRNKRWHVLAVC